MTYVYHMIRKVRFPPTQELRCSTHNVLWRLVGLMTALYIAAETCCSTTVQHIPNCCDCRTLHLLLWVYHSEMAH